MSTTYPPPPRPPRVEADIAVEGPSPRSPVTSTLPPPAPSPASPILTSHTAPPPQPPALPGSSGPTPQQPQFAELLTPLKLRRKGQPRKHASVTAGGGAVAGPSKEGYYTLDGELYRGARADPSLPTPAAPAPDDDDAITFGGSSSAGSSSRSSSSTWSWGSGNLERGRRATMAMFGRVGDALGVRRGSESTASTVTLSTDGGLRRRRTRRLSRSVSRATTRGESPERQRRVHLPRRRGFTLLVPPGEQGDRERVVHTPELGVVVERIRGIRHAAGYAATPTNLPATLEDDLPVRRGGSAPGRTRPPLASRGTSSFHHPPVPARTTTRSRLDQLRGGGGGGGGGVVRPKSVSDLMGMGRAADGKGSTSSLTSLRGGNISGEGDQLPSWGSSPSSPAGAETPGRGGGKAKSKGCWWLDVSCPTWEDLRDLGELLGLHPLSLEDVLQQDPREKLDVFDTLGYYFLVVRAVDEGYFRYTPGSASSLVVGTQVPTTTNKETIDGRRGSDMTQEHQEDDERRDGEKKEGRRRGWGMGRGTGWMGAKSMGREKVEIVEDNPGKEGLEGVGVGGLNVYLVVFADGIVSFHYDDITKHTQRVLDRLLTPTLASEDQNADWVAHGLIDSIVDAFFPLIRYVDGEVDDIDSLTIDPSTDPKASSSGLTASPASSATAVDQQHGNSVEMTKMLDFPPYPSAITDEKLYPASPPLPPPMSTAKPTTIPMVRLPTSHLASMFSRLRLPKRSSLPLPLLYLRLFFLPTSSASPPKHSQAASAIYDRGTMLKRITNMRRLVTGLTRLLGAKGQVVGRLRKRAEEGGTRGGGGVEAYLGDVEDHILLLQTSLYHYEYILSHCQPAYLSHLSVSFSFARGGTDQAILALSTVTISVLPMQFILGLFSMNVHVPTNGDHETHLRADGSRAPFWLWMSIVFIIFTVACGMVSLIRWWRYRARVKWRKKRGAEAKEGWEGYWGFD